MNWFSVLLIAVLIGEIAVFVYLIYLGWREFVFTLKDAQRLTAPIERLIDEGKRLQLLVQPFSANVNYVMGEVREVMELARDVPVQVGALAAAVGAYRTPNVQIAIQYGRDWVEERRANPIVRKLKRATRKIRKKLRKLKDQLQDD